MDGLDGGEFEPEGSGFGLERIGVGRAMGNFLALERDNWSGGVEFD